MSAPMIRPATLADIPAITAIYGDSVRHGTASFELDPPDATEMARRMSALIDGGFPYFVAADGSATIAGYAYAGLYRTRPAYRFTLEDSIYIAPDQRGRGIGRALLDKLIEESAARGFRQIIAVIGDSTKQQPSIALHGAAGFQMIGTLPAVGFKFGRWLDSVLMQRAIGPGETTPPEPGR